MLAVMILPSKTCDFRMRMFNSDGSEAEMCGNASRCVGKYVYDKGLTKKTKVSLETLAGKKILNLHVVDGKVDMVTVDMGEPILRGVDIPLKQENVSMSLMDILWKFILHPLVQKENYWLQDLRIKQLEYGM